MDHSASNALVNSLLIDIHRSLVQYAAEASPWSSEADADLQNSVLTMAAEQEESVAKMVDFLRSRKHLVDFGVYPQEYTSLHFVGLGYFLDRMKESQQALVNDLEAGIEKLAEDADAVQIFQKAVEQNQAILKTLSDSKLASAS